MDQLGRRRAICSLILAVTLLMLARGALATECQVDQSRINDNYCDCPATGEDELLTEACSPAGRFKCADREVFIASSRVHDSVCDCCDGSDELPGVCENRCDEIDRLERARKEELEANRRAGEAEFMKMVFETRRSSCDGSANASSQQVQESEQQGEPEGQKTEEGQESETNEPNEPESEEILVTEEEIQEAEKHLKILEDHYEKQVRKERRETLLLDKLSREDLEDLVVELATLSSSGVTLERLIASRYTCSADGSQACSDPVWTDDVAPVPSELVDARENFRNLKEDYESQRREDEVPEAPQEQQLNLDFGPAEVWRAMKDKCFNLRKQQYEYSLCIFGEFKQDHHRLGRFSSWTEPYGEQMYDHGDMCYSPAIARSVRVKIECGFQNELVDVFEPSTCVYQATFKTPAACVPENLDELVKTLPECPAEASQ